MHSRFVSCRCLLKLILLGLMVCQSATLASAADKAVNFSRDIKPIFANRCYACHGPDASKREAELRLDERESAVKEVIKPGNAAGSELLKRISSQDVDERMPPVDSKKPTLTPEEIDLVKRWIDQGAKFDTHWSYTKPVRPQPPAAPDKAWARNAIDQFVALGQQEHGLKPAPEADKRMLIRRLSFDLLGLPPTPAQIAEFLADNSPQAYENLVNRSLANEHYGERMALYWLDLVRFADTAGYHSDNHRDVTPYRDYVIKAFNENKPFDRFTIEQLAGDLLPQATSETKIASGYNKLLMTTEEGGAQAKEYMTKYAADRVRNVSTVWMGATMGCCECHDHKFDPYKAKDFYSLAAFFADVKEAPVGRQEQTPIPTPEQQAQLDALAGQIAAAQADLAKSTPELESAQAQWELTARNRKLEWTTLAPTNATSKGEATLKALDDGSILASGKNPASDTYTITVKTSLKGITAIRLEVLADDSLPAKGPGRSSNGNFVLHEFQMEEVGTPLKWSGATATHSQNNFPIAAAADGNPATGWAILPQVGKANSAVFETAADVGSGSETVLTFNLVQNFGTAHTVGHFRLSATTAARPVKADGNNGVPQNILDALAIEPATRSAEQKNAIAAYYRSIAPALQPLRDKVAQLTAQRDALVKAAPSTLITVSVAPREMKILPRGNWLDETGPLVAPAVPGFLATLDVKDRRANRLDLANWFVSRDNPLVARVMVNRLWKLMFGQGLVKTLDDLGSQGAWPTHPELLDYLAVEFIDSGWNVKHLIKLMALSSSYRQSSVGPKQQREFDPLNQWLARQSRFRLDAEAIRDNALAISGLLVQKIGGPSVKPYQPAGYWQYLNFPTREYVHDHGESQYRRGLYTYWQRSFLHPALLAFDAPGREECTVERPRSNTPLQALVLLNDPSYVEAARVFAGRVLREGGSKIEDRLAFALQQALGRDARPTELSTLGALYDKHYQQFAQDAASAKLLSEAGESKATAGLDPAELAAMTSVARVILNLHETITRN